MEANKMQEHEIITILRAYSITKKYNINFTDAVKFSKIKRRPNFVRCPKCDKIAHILSVNDKAARMVGGNYKAVVFCVDNMECGWDEYIEQTKDEYLNEYVESDAFLAKYK